MAVRDNIIYDLFPQAGDTSPHNEIGGGNVLSGGTIELVDRGGGDWAWQFTGANSVANGIGKAYVPSADGGGFTMAVTLKVVTAPASFNRYASMQVSTDTQSYMGVGEAGTGAVRSRFAASASGGATFTGINSTETTFVVRVKTNGAGGESLDTWKTTPGRVGTTPNGAETLAATLSRNYNQITVGGGSGTVQIKRLVFWSGEVSDADCAAVADSPTITLAIPADSSLNVAAQSGSFITATATTGIRLYSTLAGQAFLTGEFDTATSGDINATLAGAINATAVLSTGIQFATALASSATASGNLFTQPSIGFITPVLRNNTGSILSNETNVAVNVYNTETGALVVRKTGLTSDEFGNIVVRDTTMVSGTTYAYEVVLTSNGRRLPTALAA